MQKPLKRSQQLTPLSREHHDGLLFTWKLGQGLKKDVSVDRMVNYIQWFWKNHLEQHFNQEEELILPFLSQPDEQVARLQAEHKNIRSLVAGAINVDTIQSLITDLNDHIRFEERIFFPYIEQTLTPQQLDEVAAGLNEAPHCNDNWRDEFWK